MRILQGELIEENNIINIFKMPFYDEKGFFIALVNLCDRFKIDIPIWTFKEDKAMAEKGEVIILLGEQMKLRVVTVEEIT